jgi:hypothetical protein
MSDMDLSGKTRTLLEAAKGDGPSSVTKAKIWGGVAATTASAAGAGAGGAMSLGTAGAGTGKLVALGALFGSAITVGLAAALVHLGFGGPLAGPARPQAQAQASTMLAAPPPPAPAPPVLTPRGAANLGATPNGTPAPTPTPTRTLTRTPTRTTTPTQSPTPTPKTAKVAPLDDDALERESLLVAEARGALVRGNASAALSAVRAARAQTSHALVPEELSLEAKALRALGRTTEALDVEAVLRADYPDHALAR